MSQAQSVPAFCSTQLASQLQSQSVGSCYGSTPHLDPGSVPGVYLNLGHGMLGWTLALASADQVVDEISNPD